MLVCIALIVLSFGNTPNVSDRDECESGFNSFKDTPLASLDSLNIRFIGNWPFGFPEVVSYNQTQNSVFLGAGGGVYAINVTDPLAPLKVSEKVHTRGLICDMVQQDSLLYIVSGETDLDIWNVTDSNNPIHVSHLTTPGPTNDVAVSDTIVCLSCGSEGLRIINVSDPAVPYEVGSYSTGSHIFNVAVRQNHAFITDSLAPGFHVIDLSDPANPSEVGCCSLSSDPYNYSYQIIVDDTLAFITNGSLITVNVADPLNPYEAAVFEPWYWSVYRIAISENLAYVSALFSGLKVLDISDPTNPYLLGECAIPRCARGITVTDSFAYVAARYQALWIVDVTNPANPSAIGHYDCPSSARDVSVCDGYAFVGQLRAGLYILDINDPTYPYEFGRCDTNVTVVELAIDGDYAYGACWENEAFKGLMIFDISDPSAPFVTARCEMPAAWGIDKAGDHTYIAGDFGLYIYDVADPYVPFWVGYYDTPHTARGVDVIDTLAFVAEESGIRVVNVSDPSIPHEIGYHNTPGAPWRVTVVNDYAYVAGRYAGLRILDISDPTVPFEVGYCDTDGKTEKIAVAGNFAYLADGNAVRVVDITDPANPYEVGNYPTPEHARSVDIFDDCIYVACDNCGVQVYEFDSVAGIKEKEIAEIIPRDFGPTIFSGPLQLPEGKKCRVFDITGRVVAPDKITPGIYFIEVDHKITQKVIKVR